MRLSVRLASALCILTLVTPFAADAAAAAKTLRLRDIVKIMESNKKPVSFTVDITGKSGKNSGTISFTGSHNGKTTSIDDMAATMSMTLDMRLENGATISGKSRIVIVDAVAYVILDELDASGDAAPYVFGETDMLIGTWFSMPLDDVEYAGLKAERIENSSASVRQFDPFFTVTEKTQGTKTTYTATIPKAKQRRFLTKIFGKNQALRRQMRLNTIDATIIVDAVRNAFDAVSGTVNLTTLSGKEKGSFTTKVSMKVLKTAPAIAAPADSMTFEEFLTEQLGISPTMSLIEARNAQRRSDASTIVSSIYQYAIDNDGDLPMNIPDNKTLAICKARTPCAGASLDALLDSYLVHIPSDPSGDEDDLETGYTITIDDYGNITVSAPMAEDDEVISVTR